MNHPTLKQAVYAVSQDGQRRLVGIFSTDEDARELIERCNPKPNRVFDVLPILVEDESDLWPRSIEEVEVGQAILRAVFATIREARANGQYQAFDWLSETDRTHVEHLTEHVRELERKLDGVAMKKPDEAHAEHLGTRTALLLARIAREKKGGGHAAQEKHA